MTAARATAMPQLVTTDTQLAALLPQWADKARLAIDLEANGLHVYRAQLCVLQLAWETAAGINVAVVDPLSVDVQAMATLLSETGPTKLFHDMTFDAALLADNDIRLGRVEDTSVAARFLGEPETGLASLSRKWLNVHRNKKLQSHNWAKRPFNRDQLEYLAGDVVHLFALRDVLFARVKTNDIEEEVRLECDYKLAAALTPKPRTAPPYHRLKGYRQLDDEAAAVARSLYARRDALAQKRDVPPHHIAPNSLLVAIAGADVHHRAHLQRRFRSQRPFRRYAADWLDAVAQALAGDAPAAPDAAPAVETMSRTQLRQRKRLDAALSRWRQREADRRGVDRQVVIPGHCMGAVASALVAAAPQAGGAAAHHRLSTALAAVKGFGDIRVTRYADALAKLGQPTSA